MEESRHSRKKPVLERVLAEIPSGIQEFPIPIDDNHHIDGPWFHSAKRAVEILREENEIQAFMSEFTEYIQQEYELPADLAETCANKSVGYCTGYVDSDQANLWFRALPDISHPITGRERPFMQGKDIEHFYVIGCTADEEVRDFMTEEVNTKLNAFGLRVLDEQPITGKDNPEYFGYRLRMENDAMLVTNGNAYLFIKGCIMGMQVRMDEVLGKTCPISVDAVCR